MRTHQNKDGELREGGGGVVLSSPLLPPFLFCKDRHNIGHQDCDRNPYVYKYTIVL